MKTSLKPCILLLALIQLAFFPSCAKALEPGSAGAPDVQPPLRLIALDTPRYPGAPLVVALSGLDDCDENSLCAALYQNGKLRSRSRFFAPLLFLGNEQVLVAILGIPLEADMGEATIRIEGGRWPGVKIMDGIEVPIADDSLRVLDIFIDAKEYPEAILKMDAKNTALVHKADPEKTRQAELLWQTLAGFDHRALYAEEALRYPSNTPRRSSGFGDKRTYHYSNGRKVPSWHLGIDFPAPIGSPVHAPGPGRVVMARDRIVSGKSIIIEHLPGYYSLLYHLEEIKCIEGDIVQTGDLIGSIGSTGFSTGPHLHWELRTGTTPIDPEAAARAPLIDKERIITTMDEKYGRIAEGG